MLLLVGLPALNRLLTTRGMSILGKDLLISRVSVGLFALGSLVISVAPAVTLAAVGITIFALGSGFEPAARSLVTTSCHQDEAGLLYSALAIMQSIGGLVASPLLAVTFRWGLSLGDGWTGIPFAAVAGLFACGFIAISLVSIVIEDWRDRLDQGYIIRLAPSIDVRRHPAIHITILELSIPRVSAILGIVSDVGRNTQNTKPGMNRKRSVSIGQDGGKHKVGDLMLTIFSTCCADRTRVAFWPKLNQGVDKVCCTCIVRAAKLPWPFQLLHLGSGRSVNKTSLGSPHVFFVHEDVVHRNARRIETFLSAQLDQTYGIPVSQSVI